jgi:hypothetical protein
MKAEDEGQAGGIGESTAGRDVEGTGRRLEGCDKEICDAKEVVARRQDYLAYRYVASPTAALGGSVCSDP